MYAKKKICLKKKFLVRKSSPFPHPVPREEESSRLPHRLPHPREENLKNFLILMRKSHFLILILH